MAISDAIYNQAVAGEHLSRMLHVLSLMLGVFAGRRGLVYRVGTRCLLAAVPSGPQGYSAPYALARLKMHFLHRLNLLRHQPNRRNALSKRNQQCSNGGQSRS